MPRWSRPPGQQRAHQRRPFYVDHATPSTRRPSAPTPSRRSFTTGRRRVLRRSMTAVSSLMPDAPTISSTRTTLTARQLLRVPRELPHGPHRPVRRRGGGHRAHFVSRASTAARKSAARPGLDRRRALPADQRADSSRRSSLETAQAPIVNTRRAHADPKRFRRLHVIVATQTWPSGDLLEAGTTSLVSP